MQLFLCGEGWRDWLDYSASPVINTRRKTYLFKYLFVACVTHHYVAPVR